MSIHLLLTKNLRAPLNAILNSLIEQHISHRLVDDFLILTPDSESAEDLIESFLKDERLGKVLTGSSILSFEEWIKRQAAEISPQSLISPQWIREAAFQSLTTDLAFPTEELRRKFSEDQISLNSLFQLIDSFRKEHLSEKEIYLFVSQFDPLLAELCSKLYTQYDYLIKNHPLIGDQSNLTQIVLNAISKNKLESLNSLKTIYWIGFNSLAPIQKEFIQQIKKNNSIEQIVYLQKLEKKETQDFLTMIWQEKIPPFSEIKSADLTQSKKEILEFSTPFEEASFIISEIHKLIQQGIAPDQIALYLADDSFWKFHFSSQFEKLGIYTSSIFQKPLASYSWIKETFDSQIEQALEKTHQRIEEKRELFSKNKTYETSLQIRALVKWFETLEKIIFYQKELNFLNERDFALEKIASQTFISEKSNFHQEIHLRNPNRSGLKSFHSVFLFNFNDQNFPETQSSFFGFQIPDSRKNIHSQRGYFQHLFSSANEKAYLTYSNSTTDGKENSISSFHREFELGEVQKSKQPVLFISNERSESFDQRVEVEKIREKKESTSTYEGMIQSPKTKKLLEEKMKDYVYTARQLEEYAGCPFRFLTYSFLKIESPIEQTVDGSPIDKGLWLHNFLELFFTRYSNEIFEARRSLSQQEAVFSKIKKEVEEFSVEFLKERNWIHPILSNDIILQMIQTTQNMLQDYWKRAEKAETQLIPSFFEIQFDEKNQQAVVFQKGKLPPLKIRGRIDRVDLTEDQNHFLVIDYKTGFSNETSKQISEFKSFQLPIYLLATKKHLTEKLQKPVEPIGALIFDLKELKTNQGILQKQFAKSLGFSTRSGGFLTEAEWDLYWNELDEKLLSLHEKINFGDFSLKPDPCDPYCHSRTICRYYDRAKTDR